MNIIIFGGSGFIGSHFAKFLLSNSYASSVTLVDINSPSDDTKALLESYINRGSLRYVQQDVRGKIASETLPKSVDLIANFAGIYEDSPLDTGKYKLLEETNILGAKNVCQWAEHVACRHILFISTAAIYSRVDGVQPSEDSNPDPRTPYARLKWKTESIYRIWQKRHLDNYLVIVRSGEVFGADKPSVMSKLVKAILGRYFLYTKNRQTRKSCVYIKELCYAIWWVIENQKKNGEHYALFNIAANPNPSIEQLVRTAQEVAGKVYTVRSVPFVLAYSLAALTALVSLPLRLLKIKTMISPSKLKNWRRSDEMLLDYLQRHDYQWQYTLKSAFEDWKTENSKLWLTHKKKEVLVHNENS